MTSLDNLLGDATGFEWDDGNALKNWERHRVTQAEAEEVFFHRPVFVAEDVTHFDRERRCNILGRSSADRLLSVVFTVRLTLVRVISARPMSRKERTAYAKVPSEAP